jgi:16S rRNA (uracil1498-N3)-methyltransferase
MPTRVFAPALTPETTTLDLPEGEAEHLARVLRARPGDEVRVFNGRGLEREALVSRVTKLAVTLEVGRSVVAAAECRVRITLAQALLKGDKIDDIVRDATMLGVAAIQPLITHHTDVPRRAVHRGGRAERWSRIAVSSAKQCGRAVVPDVQDPASLSDCLARDGSDLRLLLAEPSTGAGAGVESRLARSAVTSVLLLVGPEGGWAPAEIQAATQAGALALTLGRRTLRADATALVALSVLLHLWGEL